MCRERSELTPVVPPVCFFIINRLRRRCPSELVRLARLDRHSGNVARSRVQVVTQVASGVCVSRGGLSVCPAGACAPCHLRRVVGQALMIENFFIILGVLAALGAGRQVRSRLGRVSRLDHAGSGGFVGCVTNVGGCGWVLCLG